MRRRRLLCPLGFCICLFAGISPQSQALAAAEPNQPIAQTKPSPATALDAMDRMLAPEQLRADFRIARQALEDGHGGIYRYTPKTELDRRFDQAEKLLTKPMSVLEFYRVLAPAVAAIKCGHTNVSLSRDFKNAYTARHGVLPLAVRVLDGNVYIWRDLSGGSVSLAGMKVQSINGVAIAKIVDKMLAAASGDGDIETIRIRRISGWAFPYRLLTLVGLSAPYEIDLWDAKAKRDIKVSLAGDDLTRLQKKARAKFPEDQQPETAGEFILLDGGAIAVMKIRGFGGFVDAQHKKSLAEFLYPSDKHTLRRLVGWGPKEAPHGPTSRCDEARSLARTHPSLAVFANHRS